MQYALNRIVNKAKVRGWYVKLDRSTPENEGGNPPVVTANQQQ